MVKLLVDDNIGRISQEIRLVAYPSPVSVAGISAEMQLPRIGKVYRCPWGRSRTTTQLFT